MGEALNGIAMGAGYTLIFGLGFWLLCIAVGYVARGVRRLVNRNNN